MMSAQDPFYIVKEEIQESIDKLQSAFHQWEQTPSETGEYVHLRREILASCESIEWQTWYQICMRKYQASEFGYRKVDELDKAIAVASKDPAYYRIDEAELEKRKRWTSNAHNQVSTLRKGVDSGKEQNNMSSLNINGRRQELMWKPDDPSHQGTSTYLSPHDDLISSESDRQLLLIRQQDDELDELSASVQRIGGVGLTIHEELVGQERILGELSMEMETTSNRLDFVQKKVAMVMKKAGAKGQLLMMAFLIVLFIILFVLVFFT